MHTIKDQTYKHVLYNCEKYFGSSGIISNVTISKWIKKYEDKIKNISHDEPWLTLMSLYSIFGDQSKIGDPKIANILQNTINNIGLAKVPKIKKVEKVRLERVLPEIEEYKKFMYKIINKGSFHLYPDRNATLQERSKKKKESIEGNTNLDAQIEFYNDEEKTSVVFIEAKFLSDIDTKTTYNPVRNQIIRNIDAMIDSVNSNDEMSFDNTYFWLLTPQIFRTGIYGGSKKNGLSIFNPQYGRYYSYIMDRYKNPKNIEKDLPHRKLDINTWEAISANIGWLTFEDIYKSMNLAYVVDPQYIDDFRRFYEERSLL